MPITEHWNEWVKNNKDPYGKACVDVARRVMEILDESPDKTIEPDYEEFSTWAIICQAGKDTDVGGITGFMSGAVSSMVSHCHSRGEEWHQVWNRSNQIGGEGDRANEKGTVLNPALLNVSTKS